MPENIVDVVVVGAGPVGLTAALLLKKSGISVAVVEKSAGPVAQSRAIWVHSRTLEIWNRIGMSELALAEGKLVDAIEMHVGGTRKAVLPYNGGGLSEFPHGLMLEQSRTQTLLAGLASRAGIPILWDTEVVDIVTNRDGCEVSTTTSVDSGRILAKYVVGSDGGSSTVRHLANIDLEGGTYDASFFVADVVAETEMDACRAHLNFSGKSTVAVLPLPGNGRFRLVGNIIDQSGESREAGYGRSLSFVEVQKLVAANQLPMTVIETGWTTTYRSHFRVAQSFRAGRLLLAGDASHLHSPAGGLGMNTGVADAENLAWRLAGVLNGANDDSLDRYSLERRGAAQGVIRTSDRLFVLQASTRGFFVMMRTTRLPHVVRLISRTKIGQHIAFFALSGTRVRYPAPQSPRKTLGRLRAGALLPHTSDEELNAKLSANRGQYTVLTLGKSSGQSEIRESIGQFVNWVELTNEQSVSLTGRANRRGMVLVRPDGYVDVISVKLDAIRDQLQIAGVVSE